MLDDVSVLIPYRPDGAFRDAAWESVVQIAWEQTGAELLVASPGPGASPAEFNHPAAINEARRRATRPILMVSDADCLWTPVNAPARLAYVVREGGAPWAMLRRYATLGQQQSRSIVLRKRWTAEQALSRASWVGDKVSWAGLICMRAEDFDTVGGYDERFAWWGADDQAFGLTMDALVGKHARVEGSVLHLWHPAPLRETYGHREHRRQYNLAELYRKAAGNPAAIRDVRFGLDHAAP